jgi:acetoacetate decarboxylase
MTESTTIRYGARSADQQRNREIEAVQTEIWSQAVTVVFETDPDVIAQVLPRPLEPAEPTARVRIATVDMGTGLRPFGAGWFGVRARHGEQLGEYALFMPMTTEQATIGGRETYGEPKKIGDVVLSLDGDRITGWIERMGFRSVELSGVLGSESAGYERDKLDFYFKFNPAPDGVGFDHDPVLVYCHRHERARRVRPVDGELKLLDSPLDPVADIPVRRIVSMEYAELATHQRGEIIEQVPTEWLLPFVHQRYDDLSVLGGK